MQVPKNSFLFFFQFFSTKKKKKKKNGLRRFRRGEFANGIPRRRCDQMRAQGSGNYTHGPLPPNLGRLVCGIQKEYNEKTKKTEKH
jgi:hypothetical protein